MQPSLSGYTEETRQSWQVETVTASEHWACSLLLGAYIIWHQACRHCLSPVYLLASSARTEVHVHGSLDTIQIDLRVNSFWYYDLTQELYDLKLESDLTSPSWLDLTFNFYDLSHDFWTSLFTTDGRRNKRRKNWNIKQTSASVELTQTHHSHSKQLFHVGQISVFLQGGSKSFIRCM